MEGPLPPISIIISAYNEAAVIEQRLLNLAESTYPRDLYEVILMDDCSTDGTAEIADRILTRLGVEHRIVRNTDRLGPSRSYNRGLSLAKNDIVVTTDADVFFDKDSLSLLITRLMSDERIVAACGDLQPLPDRASTRAMESIYRGYYGRMCAWESAIDSCYTFNGALVAFRRSSIPKIEDRKGADDANTAFEAIRNSCRSVYEPRAMVFEEIPEGIERQYRQKVRRATGLIEATLGNLDLLHSSRPFSRFF
ncbi:MAG TPA: glycosyltransferase, partial [Methanomicrobiales archaeon]|nr:glycosyltransferase [Methanomicrobiales archaeon]